MNNDEAPIVLLIVIVLGYFLPTIIAACSKHRQLTAIFFVNLLFGVTVIGWVIAFVWSLVKPSAPAAPTVIYMQAPAPGWTPPQP